jgi:hypothetical protein
MPARQLLHEGKGLAQVMGAVVEDEREAVHQRGQAEQQREQAEQDRAGQTGHGAQGRDLLQGARGRHPGASRAAGRIIRRGSRRHNRYGASDRSSLRALRAIASGRGLRA